MKTALFFRNFNEIEFSKLEKGSCVFIGNEGCIYKLPRKDELQQLKKSDETLEIHIITPLVSQTNLQLAKDRIDDLISSKLIASITFNDYGLFYYTADNHRDSGVKYYLGRLLTKSFSDCPWSDHLNRNEDEHVQKYMNGFVMNDPRKIKLFQDMGVTGVHLSVNKKNIAGLNEISESGLDIIVHLDTIIGAASRICSQAQYHDVKYPDCKEKCEQPAVLKLSRLWSLKEDGYIEPSEEVKQVVPQYIVAGNITYYRNPDYNFLIDRSDSIEYGIMDYTFNQPQFNR